LAQCTAFLERAPPPKSAKAKEAGGASSSSLRKAKLAAGEQLPAYNPADYAPGQGYVDGSQSKHPAGKIVLIDEEDGSVIGELGEGYQVVEDDALLPGSKGMPGPLAVPLLTDPC
jgi:spartin